MLGCPSKSLGSAQCGTPPKGKPSLGVSTSALPLTKQESTSTLPTSPLGILTPMLPSPSGSEDASVSPGYSQGFWSSEKPSVASPVTPQDGSVYMTPPTSPKTNGPKEVLVLSDPDSPLLRKATRIKKQFLVSLVEIIDEGEVEEALCTTGDNPKIAESFRHRTNPPQKGIQDASGDVVNATLSSVSDAELSPSPTAQQPKNNESPQDSKCTASSHKTSPQSPGLPAPVRELEFIVPSEIRKRLSKSVSNEELKCIASLITKSSRRQCTSKAHPSGDNFLTSISKLGANPDWATFIYEVSCVVKSTMCGTHRRSAFEKSRWQMLQMLVQRPEDINADDQSHFYDWIYAISGSSPRFSNIPNIEPYQPRKVKDLPVSEALRRLITEPFSSADKPGFIYIYSFKDYYGHVKIGRSVNPDTRLKRWNKDCKRIYDFHPSSLKQELEKVNHLKHVEDLIHTELKNQRKHLKCEECGSRHNEWFEVSGEHVVKVFRKWSNWIRQDPYEKRAKTGKWVLKQEMYEKLEEICRPVERLIEQKPKEAQKQKHKSPSRLPVKQYNLRLRSGSSHGHA